MIKLLNLTDTTRVFATQCLLAVVRTSVAGQGSAPISGQPLAVTDYMTEQGLRALVRDPKSVRTWQKKQMPAFPPTILPDADIDALIAYFKQIASQRDLWN